jgi:MFS family permease
MNEPTAVGYVSLLRRNRDFRCLWYGQVASQLGDWLDFIALSTLLLRLSGSPGSAVAGLLVAQALPFVVVGMSAGVLADRLPRKAILIATDLGRALLVLLFLFVREPGQVWLVYAVLFLKFTLSSFFEPAREAVVPSVVARNELVAANAIGGLTWSVILAGGAALGGLVTEALGTDLAFILDSVSFVLSALFTWCVPIPETHLEERTHAHPWTDVREGLGHLLARRDVALYALSKSFWCLGGGGVLVVLPLLARDLFPLGQEGALSLGLLYAARGVGAGIGPVLAGRLGGHSVRFLRRALGVGFLLMAVGYLLVSGSPVLAAAAASVSLAHCGGSMQWVFSTALIQLTVPNRLQGRVFAVEQTLYTLVTCISSYLTGMAADGGVPPRTLVAVLASTFILPGVALLGLLWMPPREAEGMEQGDPDRHGGDGAGGSELTRSTDRAG